MTMPPTDTSTPDTRPLLITPPPPLDGFSSEEFCARREALRAACPDGIVVVRGATEDEAVPPGVYRQNSPFFYLTGVDTPGALLVMLPQGVPASAGIRGVPAHLREFLFLPARNPQRETWTGPKLGPDAETERITGVEKVADVSGIWNALIGWLHRCPLIYTLAPYGEQARSTREYALMERIGSLAPVAQFRDVASQVARLRVVKSSAEVERIAQAIAVTAAGQRVARERIVAGAGCWEYEVEGAIYEAFRQQGASLAFPPIVGAGINATVLHYEDNRCRIEAGDAVVVDIGAQVGHYCGDLTRTYAAGGRFSARQREIYALVLQAHRQAVADYRPGEDTLDTLKARCLDVLKASPLRARDSFGDEQTMDTFMPHGLSHHLGLDVHDVGDREAALAPGSVITIEPGLYIPYEGIGVRLEDDYLVTETGLQRLGLELPFEEGDR